VKKIVVVMGLMVRRREARSLLAIDRGQGYVIVLMIIVSDVVVVAAGSGMGSCSSSSSSSVVVVVDVVGVTESGRHGRQEMEDV